MVLTKENALQLLMEAKELRDGKYIEHSLCVGEAAGRIAKAIGLDENKATAMGYIHDIGKRFELPFSYHVAKGYEYLKELEFDDEYCDICLTHSYLDNSIICTAGGIVDPESYRYEFRKDFIEEHTNTDYDKIVQFSDLMCTGEFLIMEERLIEIMVRRGSGENTQYHLKEAIKLRKELEEKIGHSVYKLFPEIKQRLF